MNPYGSKYVDIPLQSNFRNNTGLTLAQVDLDSRARAHIRPIWAQGSSNLVQQIEIFVR